MLNGVFILFDIKTHCHGIFSSEFNSIYVDCRKEHKERIESKGVFQTEKGSYQFVYWEKIYFTF